MQNRKLAIFADPPDAIDETWVHGVLMGGMAHGAYNQLAIADSYVSAGSILVEKSVGSGNGYEVAYPIMFCYRHSIELYLKVILRPEKRTHALMGLLRDLEKHVAGSSKETLPQWFTSFITELASFDPASMLFRYEDADEASSRLQARGEFWVDLVALQRNMSRVQEVFHSLAKKSHLPAR